MTSFPLGGMFSRLYLVRNVRGGVLDGAAFSLLFFFMNTFSFHKKLCCWIISPFSSPVTFSEFIFFLGREWEKHEISRRTSCLLAHKTLHTQEGGVDIIAGETHQGGAHNHRKRETHNGRKWRPETSKIKQEMKYQNKSTRAPSGRMTPDNDKGF